MAWQKVEEEQQANFVKLQLGVPVEGTLVKVWTDEAGKFGPQTYVQVDTGDELLDIKAGWDLKTKIAKVPEGARVRLTHIEDRDVGKQYPMPVIDVEFDAEPPKKSAAPVRNGRATFP